MITRPDCTSCGLSLHVDRILAGRTVCRPCEKEIDEIFGHTSPPPERCPLDDWLPDVPMQPVSAA